MAVHEIRIPDRIRGRELRSILWDHEAGRVSGDHFDVAFIPHELDAPKPVAVGGLLPT